MNVSPELVAVMGPIDFDPDALKSRYLAERDKRLRSDGIAQYVEVKAEFSRGPIHLGRGLLHLKALRTKLPVLVGGAAKRLLKRHELRGMDR